MRGNCRAQLCLLACLVVTPSLFRAQSAPASNNASVLLTMAKSAFSGYQSVQSVSLNGRVHRIVGSDIQDGVVTLVASSDGSYSSELKLTSLDLKETRSAFSTGHRCTETKNDTPSRTVAAHNCMLPVTWFLPAIAWSGTQPATIATELDNGALVQYDTTVPDDSSPDFVTKYQGLSRISVLLDPQTHTPTVLTYQSHPPHAMNVDIPVKVEYSDYQSFGVVTVPTHIKRYRNGVLELEISIDSASVQ